MVSLCQRSGGRKTERGRGGERGKEKAPQEGKFHPPGSPLLTPVTYPPYSGSSVGRARFGLKIECTTDAPESSPVMATAMSPIVLAKAMLINPLSCASLLVYCALSPSSAVPAPAVFVCVPRQEDRENPPIPVVFLPKGGNRPGKGCKKMKGGALLRNKQRGEGAGGIPQLGDGNRLPAIGGAAPSHQVRDWLKCSGWFSRISSVGVCR